MTNSEAEAEAEAEEAVDLRPALTDVYSALHLAITKMQEDDDIPMEVVNRYVGLHLAGIEKSLKDLIDMPRDLKAIPPRKRRYRVKAVLFSQAVAEVVAESQKDAIEAARELPLTPLVSAADYEGKWVPTEALKGRLRLDIYEAVVMGGSDDKQ